MFRAVPTFCVAVLALGCAPALAYFQESRPAPSGLFFPEKRYRFAPVVGLHHLYHTFAFTNPGAAPIKIRDVKISCSCTMAGISIDGAAAATGAEIPSGGSGFLRFRATTEGIDGVKPVQIEVLTDRGQDVLVLILESQTEFTIEPRVLDFGQVVSGDEAKLRVRVASRDGRAFEVRDWGIPKASAPAPTQGAGQSLDDYEAALELHDRREQLALREKPSEVQLALHPVSAGLLDLEIAYRPTGEPGARNLVLRCLTDLDLAFKLSAAATVVGPVHLQPAPYVYLGDFTAGAPQRWEFFLVDRDPERTVRVTRASVRSSFGEHLKAEVEQVAAKGAEERTRIVLTAAATLPMCSLDGVLRVETDDPRFPSFETKFGAIAHGD